MNDHRHAARQIAVLSCVASLAGCAHAYTTWPYPGWYTIGSAHFHVHGPDQSELPATALMLEGLYTAIGETFFPRADLHGIEVVVFGTEEDARDLPPKASGFLDEKKASGGILVLTAREPRLDRRANDGRFTTPNQEKAAHTIAQRLLRNSMQDAPEWFRDGFLLYLETLQLHDDTAVFGNRPTRMTQELMAGRAIPLGALIAAPHSEFSTGDWTRSHHASAWAFIHFLLGGDGGRLRPNFDALCRALTATPPGPEGSRQAIERAFPGSHFSEIENRARDYAVNDLGGQPRFHPFAVNVKLPGGPPPAPVLASPKHVQNLLLQLKHR